MEAGPAGRPARSIWDRLTGVEAGATAEEIVRNEVRRDLQWLLNTRRSFHDDELDLPHLERSLLAFGIPELSAINPKSTSDRQRLVRVIAQAIERFEPRLTDLEVEHHASEQDPHNPRLHFRIRATLRLPGMNRAIAFDTELDLGARAFAVKS